MIVIGVEQRHERVRIDKQRLWVGHVPFPYSISSTCCFPPADPTVIVECP